MAGNAMILSDKFEIEPDETVVSRFEVMGKLKSGHSDLDGNQWQQIAARYCFGGVPPALEDGLRKLEPLEIAVRLGLGRPSERPGGKRSLGTGMTLDENFKSYKSTLKGAAEFGVQLLDATGMPRSRNDISDDIKNAKPPKDPEEKLMGAAEMFIKLHDHCDPKDPRTVDAVNHLVNWLEAKGLVNVRAAA